MRCVAWRGVAWHSEGHDSIIRWSHERETRERMRVVHSFVFTRERTNESEEEARRGDARDGDDGDDDGDDSCDGDDDDARDDDDDDDDDDDGSPGTIATRST